MRSARAVFVALAVALAGCRETAAPAPVSAPPQTASSQTAASQSAPFDAAIVRYVIGGDSRQDTAHVVPWALRETRARGAAAMIYLGDMELKPDLDAHFLGELADLGPVPFYPVLGNHEIAKREHGKELARDVRVGSLRAFGARFLGTTRTPVKSAFDDKLAYALDLPGGVHFVALDNVSQPGFGADQLAWLEADLEQARREPKTKHIVIGMHKALVGSGATTHAMDEDGPASAAESATAIGLFEQAHVELIVASHYHGFVEYVQRGIRSFITGGLGAPLDMKNGAASGFHHFLVVSVRPNTPLAVDVVRFPGAPAIEHGKD